MANDSTQSWEDHVAAIQSGTDEAVVDTAVRALQSLIEQTAERVCRRRMVSKQVRMDFVDEAVPFVVTIPRESKKDGVLRPPISTYDPASGSFPAWLWTMLDRRLTDIRRSAGRRAAHEQTMVAQEGEPGFIESTPDPRPHRAADNMDRTTPFCDCDFQQIAAWPVLDRILVLVVFELWRKVSVGVWSEWCSEAGLPNALPQDAEDRRERGEWISHIAELLSASPNALQNRLRRRLKKLEDEPLDYIRGISHGE